MYTLDSGRLSLRDQIHLAKYVTKKNFQNPTVHFSLEFTVNVTNFYLQNINILNVV